MHPDHSNGLTDENGVAKYPHVELVVAERDVNHWFDDAAMARATERQQIRFFRWAREQIAPYQKQRREPKGEVFPGVTAVPLYGHTPGHTGYLISSKGQQLLIWGDIVHMPDIQTQRPDVYMEPDVDGDAAIATRKRTLDMVATDRLTAAGMHMHFPGFLNLKAAGGRISACAGDVASGVPVAAGTVSGPASALLVATVVVVVAFTTGP